MDCKIFSVLRASLRLVTPWSVIWTHLFLFQQIDLTKATYSWKLSSMDCKALSVLRLSLRLFRPWSEILLHLFIFQKFILQKSLTPLWSWGWWIAKQRVFWDFHWDWSGLHLWFFRNCEQLNKLILQNVLTSPSRGWSIVRHGVVWELHWDCSDLDLLFGCSSLKSTNSSKFTY